MKGKHLEKSYNLLVLNNFEEMELILTKRFLSYFDKLLPLQNFYLDWIEIQKLTSLLIGQSQVIHLYEQLF